MTLTPQSPSALARWYTTVIYGPSGGGKTSLAATAPRPYVVDSNKGLLVINQRKGLEHVRGNDFTGMAMLDEVLAHFRGQVKPDFRKLFETCTFDHFDDIQAHILEQLGDAAHKKDDRLDPDVPDQRAWGKMGSQLRRYIRKFKRVPVHKILICAEKEDAEGRMRPALQGQLGQQLPYFADHIFYLRVGSKGRRFLHLDPTDTFYAKTRAWWLPERKIQIDFDNPQTLTDLFALIAAGPKTGKKKRSINSTGE